MLGVLLLLVIVIVAIGLLSILKGKPIAGKGNDYPYTQRPALFTPAERSFLGVLDQAVGEQYRIFGKVRVADVIQVRKSLNNSRRQTAFNKIQSKHFDFLLCARSDLSVLCAIELDDKSHKQRRRQERDHFLVNACRASGVPLVQVPAQQGYTVHELRTRIYDSLESVTLKETEPQAAAKGPTGAPFPTAPQLGDLTSSSTPPQSRSEPQFGSIFGMSAMPSAEQASQFDARAKDPTFPAHPDVPKTDKGSEGQENGPAAVPTCPKCGSPMVRRRVKSGSRAGLVFWGCSTYPKCRGALRDGPSKPVAAQTPSNAADIDG